MCGFSFKQRTHKLSKTTMSICFFFDISLKTPHSPSECKPKHAWHRESISTNKKNNLHKKKETTKHRIPDFSRIFYAFTRCDLLIDFLCSFFEAQGTIFLSHKRFVQRFYFFVTRCTNRNTHTLDSVFSCQFSVVLTCHFRLLFTKNNNSFLYFFD